MIAEKVPPGINRMGIAPDIKRMEGCMFAADQLLDNIQTKAILIVGKTRIGKSSLFNHIIGVRLRGIFERQNGLYLLPVDQGQGARTANTYDSVTLIPNIKKVVIGKQEVNLFDVAGFHDERDYIGVFGVSYILGKIFQKLQKVKFILTVSAQVFFNGQIKIILDSIQPFAQMFMSQILLTPNNAQIAKNLYNSISLVLTKCDQGISAIKQKINKILQHMKKKRQNSNIQKVIMKILQSILQKDRIQIFQKATPNQCLARSQILQNLSKPQKSWQYYNFKEKFSHQNLIRLPFEKNYNNLGQDDQKDYSANTERKLEKVKSSYQLLQKFFMRAIKFWYNQEPVDYSDLFQQLQEIIRDHPYGDFTNILKHLSLELKIPEGSQHFVTRLSLLDELRKIEKFTRQIDQVNGIIQVFKKFQKMMDPCKGIFNISRDIFCKTRQQEQKFLIFMFINLRCLYQGQMQNKIDKTKCAELPFTVSGPLMRLLPGSIWDMQAMFLIDFAPTSEQQEQYNQKINSLIKDINQIQNPQHAKKLIEKSMTNKLKIADSKIQKSLYIQAIKNILSAQQTFMKYLQFQPFDSQSSKARNYTEYKQLSIYKKLAHCLQKINYPALAIQIYESTSSVYLLKRCYEQWIGRIKKKAKKYDVMIQYLDVLKRYGQREKSINLYEQMIDEFQCFPSKRSQLKKQLQQYLRNQSTDQIKKYANKLDLPYQGVIDNSDLMTTIAKQLKTYVPLDHEQLDEDQDEDTLFEQDLREQNEQYVYDD